MNDENDAQRSAPPPADIEVGAVAKAKKLRFETEPETKLEFPGSAPSSGSRTERKNLPDEVEPGVTYRDVEVRWLACADVEARVLVDEDGNPLTHEEGRPVREDES
ncbi:MAG TPA: hypothetical protein VHJ54_04995 [Solirubrobacterales bacterium]|jgi:hypothetical protein|nr:hypothetical protein [Solirubrobacterales bacterium]